MSKSNLRALASLAIASIVSAGCSLAVKSELDGKPSQPEDSCTSNADCTAAFQVCQINYNGIDYFQACSCAHGYEADAATGDCEFVGIIAAPGFDDGAAWTVHGDTELNPSGAGNGDPGVVVISQDAVCDPGSNVTQTVTLSAATDSVPLALEVTYRTTSGWPPRVPIAIGVNGAWTSLPGSDNWTTGRVCVGPRGTGGDAVVTLASAFSGPECQWGGFSSDLVVTRLEIVEADPNECPPIGGLVNADFEGAGGWVDAEIEGDAFAGIEAGIGVDGSSALRIGTGPGGGYAGSSASAILPEDSLDGAAAVSFWATGTPGAQLSVRTGIYEVGRVTIPALGWAQYTLCVPPFARGGGQNFGFTTRPVYTNGAEIVVDDIEFVMRGECDDNETVSNGGFELVSAPDITSNVRSIVSGGSNGTLTFAPVSDPVHAHSGDATLLLQAAARCDTVNEENPPRFMAGGWEPGELEKPALVFWYFIDSLSDFQVRSTLDGSSGWWAEDPLWQRHRVCLPPDSNGRPTGFDLIFTNQAGGGCADVLPQQRMYIDDMEVVDDPTCP